MKKSVDKKTKTSSYKYLYLREKIYKRDKRTLKRSTNYRQYDGAAYKARGRHSKTVDIKYLGKIYYPGEIDNIDFEEYLEKNKNLSFSELLTQDYDNIVNTYYDYLLSIIHGEKSESVHYALNDGILSIYSLDPLLKFEFRIGEDYNARTESDRFARMFKRAGFLWAEKDLRSRLLQLKVEESLKKAENENIDKIEQAEYPPEITAGLMPEKDLSEFYTEWYGSKYEKRITKIRNLRNNYK